MFLAGESGIMTVLLMGFFIPNRFINVCIESLWRAERIGAVGNGAVSGIV
jgi:hypothetical protein